MRLTLRTMLAYLDEILDPEDAEAIGKKIEESEFATNLLHRTRQVMRRLRLATPDAAERGAALDANTVAEYLDHMLPPDRVPDFEKVCLESDTHLAEVASCHQVLALVLGEPVDVGVATRQRMYRLPDMVTAQVKAAHDAAGLPPVEPAAKPPSGVSVPSGEGPVERPKKLRWPRTVAAAGLVLLSGALLLAATGQFSSGSWLMETLGLSPSGEPVAQAPGQGQPAGGVAPQVVEPPSVRPGQEEPAGVPAPGPGAHGAPVGPSQAVPATESSKPATGPSAPAPSTEVVGPGKGPTGAGGKGSGGVSSAAAAGGGPERAAPPDASPEATQPAAGPPTALAQPPVADLAMGRPDVSVSPGAKPGTPEEAVAQTPSGPAPVPVEPVGQLDSPTQVLLTFDQETAAWRRVPDQTALTSQTSYLCLPTFRPVIRLGDRMQLVLAGGTRVELSPPDQEGVPGLTVDYGRLVVQGSGGAQSGEQAAGGIRLRFRVEDRSGTVTFGDAESKLAIEVSRAPGSHVDPETQPSPLRADLYAVSGKILWQEQPNRQPMAINAPVGLRLSQQSIEFMAAETVPEWIIADTIKLLDQRASATIERELAAGQPVVLRLRELADHRQREVRWLAIRSLGWIGDFELMVAKLDDPNERSTWRDYVDELRAAVARGPQVAAQVRTVMERLHGDEGAYLYEMLWKYGDGSVGKQDIDRLVEFLEHDTLAFRRLGFWNLQQATGGPDLFYRPEDPEAKRRVAVRKWKEWLKSNPPSQAESKDAPQPPGGTIRRTPEEILPPIED